MGISVAHYRYAHTLVGGAFAGVAGCDVHARADAAVGQRDHRRRGLDRDRARHLRVLAARALPRRRVLLRRAAGARARAAGAQHHLGPTELWTNALPYIATIVVLVVRLVAAARAPARCARRARHRVRRGRKRETPLQPSRCAASRSGSPASSRTTASTSRPRPARCTRCSARTARASRRSRTS